MLQLSNLELAEFVDAEIEQNPLLEHGEARRRRRRRPRRRTGVGTAETRAGRRWPKSRRAATISPATPPSTGTPPPAPTATARSIAAATAQPWRTPQRRRSTATICPASTRPRRGRAPCASICSSRSAPTSPTRPTGSSPCYLLDQLDEAGYLRGDLDEAARPARLRAGAGRARCSRGCRSSTRPASSPAICRNAWRCSCATATGSTRRCRRCSTTCRCWRRATSRR